MKVVVIGAGPAGLFCADRLADQIGGPSVRVIDAGRRMERRWCPETRRCACQSCFVLEGEGGAGGFSDGKLPFSLTRGTQLEQIFDESAEPLLWEIDKTVVDLAGPGLWYDPIQNTAVEAHFRGYGMEFGTYPLRHVGSDGVRRWSAAMTKRLESKGVSIQYGDEVMSVYGGRDGRQYSVNLHYGTFDADAVVIASGIQGLPWSEMVLSQLGIPLTHGPAGIGLRVETPSTDMAPLFEQFYDWKIIYQPKDSDLVLRSFCCNHQGAITNQWHKTMGVRGVNGHSSLDPDERTQSSNFAVIAKIPESFAADPQTYVQSVARSINALSGGHTACEWLTDFLHPQPSRLMRRVDADWRTNRNMARDRVDIAGAMPAELMKHFQGFIIRLFDAVDSLRIDRAIVYAPEIKYPARRVPVDFGSWQVQNMPGLYVVGDASGYLDSFVAAAVSGLIAAQHIAGGGPKSPDTSTPPTVAIR